MRAQPCTKNCRQIGKTENERGALPQRRVQQLVVQCRMDMKTLYGLTRLYLEMSIYLYTYACNNN